MMIDWVSVLIPLAHSKQINGGNVVSVDPDGNIDWQVETLKDMHSEMLSNMDY